MQFFPPTDTPARFDVNRTDVSWRIVDGEAVLVHLGSTHYYSLNGSGTIVWERLAASPATLDELSSHVAAYYAREAGSLQEDVSRIVEELREEGLIRHVG